MSCGFDLGCYFEPAVSLWQTVVAFWNTWWPVFLFDAGMLIGSILGPRIVIALNTIGFGWWLYDRFKPVPEPIETDLSPRDREPAPKKPKKVLFPGGFEDLLGRGKK